MGERGPLKKPRAHRRGGELAEGLEPSAIPDPPERLSESSAAIWEELARILAPVGRLTPADHAAFEVLVTAIADFREARTWVDSKGVVILQGGQLVKNPALAIAESAAKTITSSGAKFGLSPSDRERLKSGDAPPASRADQRLPRSQGGRPRRQTGTAPPLRIVAPDAG